MTIVVSLGWNCLPTQKAVSIGLRPRKRDGYKTCPFDIMNSNYEGLIQCLYDDFKYFTDPEYLELKHFSSKYTCHSNDIIIRNKKYGFLFNHESPGHAELYKKENWPKGIMHFVDNNFEEFCTRYNQRIQNFREYIKSGEDILFITNRPNDDYSDLYTCLTTVYPNLNFRIANLYSADENPRIYLEVHEQMGVAHDSKEIIQYKKKFNINS